MNADLIKKNLTVIESVLIFLKRSKKGLAVFDKSESWASYSGIDQRTNEERDWGVPFSLLGFSHSHFVFSANQGIRDCLETCEKYQFELADYFRDLKLTDLAKKESDETKDISTLSLDGLLWRVIDSLYLAKLELAQVKKTTEIFASNDNWSSHEWQGQLTDFFEYNGLDPRIIAYKGLEHLSKAESLLTNTKYDIEAWIRSNRQAKTEGHA